MRTPRSPDRPPTPASRGGFSFLTKLLMAMMGVVVGVTGATLFLTQQRVQATYRELFEQQFVIQSDLLEALRESRLAAVKDTCDRLSRSVRLQALIRRWNDSAAAGDTADLETVRTLLYQTAEDELRYVLDGFGTSAEVRRTAFFRFIDFDDEIVRPEPGRGAGPMTESDRLRWGDAFRAISQNPGVEPVTGHLSTAGDDTDTDTEPDTESQPEANSERYLIEVIFTPIIDVREGDYLGGLVLGYRAPESESESGSGSDSVSRTEPHSASAPESGFGMTLDFAEAAGGLESIDYGIWLDGVFFARGMAESDRNTIASEIGRRVPGDSRIRERQSFTVDFGGMPRRAYFAPTRTEAPFPTAYNVSLFSLDKALAQQRSLRTRIGAFGMVATLCALGLSFLLAHGLSGPIKELVAGTREIERGNLGVSLPVRSGDEIGHLTDSFNQMARGLALKEKYRSVLDKVADRDIARELLRGDVKLGGEAREVSVLFCDIRGFTALSHDMDPANVITMLNEHFTPLARIVADHRGVVDKFVGDLIMAIFGAPKRYGDDAWNAVACALRMIEARERLNRVSEHRIHMGIGVATGMVVAGNMGSEDRLNYTVLGQRVNLASRLCGQADRMSVVIDQATHDQLAGRVNAEPMPAMRLKGFAREIAAFKLLSLKDPVTERPRPGSADHLKPA